MDLPPSVPVPTRRFQIVIGVLRGLLIGSCGLLVFEILHKMVPGLKRIHLDLLPDAALPQVRGRGLIALSDMLVLNTPLWVVGGLLLYACFLYGVLRAAPPWWSVVLCILYEVTLITSAIVMLRLWGESLQDVIMWTLPVSSAVGTAPGP